MAIYKEERIKVPRFEESAGFYTTKARSKIMSKIKARDTKPEIKFRKALWSIGVRYRKNVKSLPGKPDIVIGKYKIVIFIDGEFWHGHNWEEKKTKLKTNRKFWIPKIERNIQRDNEVNLYFANKGYIVLRFWQFQIEKEFAMCINKVLSAIEERELYPFL